MKTLINTNKITLATLKSFANRNKDNLFCKENSSFDGMVDCVMPSQNRNFKKTTIEPNNTGYYRTGIQGIYTVGSGRDYFTLYKDDQFLGIEVLNCCGVTILATKK